MVVQFLLQDSVDLEHPVWCTDDVHVIKECKNLLARQQSLPHCGEGPVQPKCEQEWHEGVALLPSLPLLDVL